MTSQIKRLDNGNIELTFTLVWTDIAAAQEKITAEAVKQAEIKGFRKGHAPRSLVEPQLDKAKILSHAINDLLPKRFTAAIEEHAVKPVVYPKIQIQKGREGEDWEFLALVCEAPTVKLPDLTKTIGKLEKKLEIRMEELLRTSQISLSDLLVGEEVNHRLTRLAENLSALGMTVDKYLESKKTTLEEFKAKTATEARHDLSVEFILQKIQVDQKIKDRKQALDYLTNLV